MKNTIIALMLLALILISTQKKLRAQTVGTKIKVDTSGQISYRSITDTWISIIPDLPGKSLQFSGGIPQWINNQQGITTVAITNLGSTTATSGGNVLSDGGAKITAKGVCWSTSPNPTIADAHTTDGSGIGSFISNISGLNPNTTYYIRAYATNSVGTAYGGKSILHSSIPVVYDIDGNGYDTIHIGTQIWMTQNLKTTRYNNGDIIPNVTDGSQWVGSGIGARCYYNNDSSTHSATYGALYNYYTVNTGKLCPVGWYVPTINDWMILKNQGSIEMLNNHGLSLFLNSGIRDASGNYSYIGSWGTWWSSSEVDCCTAWMIFNCFSENLHASYYDGVKTQGSSVRCLKINKANMQTIGVSLITPTSAVSGGTIISNGGSEITQKGVCWGINQNPTISDNHTIESLSSENFVSNISGLTTGLTYYVRAYAINSVGISYGNEISFVAQSNAPTLSSVTISDINSTTCLSISNIISDGGEQITAKGVCWSTSPNPTILDNYTNDGTGSSSFISNISGLTSGTTYYIKTYATNLIGTSYSDELSFTTLPNMPIINPISSLTSVSAVTGGVVTNDGLEPITAYGICWSTSPNPDINDAMDNYTNEGTGTGSFVRTLMNLTVATTYYARVYAINASGIIYSNEISFTTLAELPIVSTKIPTLITPNSATSGGEISYNGGDSIISRGVCWSTNSNPSLSDFFTTNGIGTGEFVSNITGLVNGLTYYIRAYATNSIGTSYGNEVSFIAQANLPTIKINSFIFNDSNHQLFVEGSILSDGGLPIITKGFCWSLQGIPTIANNNINIGGLLTNFAANISNVSFYTYVRAYATNILGTSYSDVIYITNPAKPE